MARRHRPPHRTVMRLLVRLLVAAGVIAAVWATLAARSTAALAVRARLAAELTRSGQRLAEFHDPTPQQFADAARLLGLDRALLLAPAEDGERLRSVAATTSGEENLDLWRLALTNPGLEEIVEAARGQVVETPGRGLLEIAVPAGGGRVIYAAVSAAPIAAARRAATLPAILRAGAITLVVGLAVLGLLWWRVALPIHQLAAAAGALAARRTASRIALGGPDEVATLGAALNALASDAEAERQRADRETRRWRALFDEIPEAAFVFAANGRALDANRQAQALTGHSLETLRQRPREELTTPEGALRLAGGDLMPAHWVETPLEHEGRPATLAVAIDLRAVERAESKLRHLEQVLDALDTGVLELDAEGLILTANPAAGALLGEALAALRGQEFTDLVAKGADLPPWPQIAEEVLREGVWSGECAPAHGAACALRIVALPDGGEEGPTFLVTAHRVDRSVGAEDRAAPAEAMAQVGAIAAGVNAAVEDALRGTLTYAGHLKTIAGTDPAVRAGLASIEDASRHALDQIERLGDHLRRVAVRVAPADLDRLLREAAAESGALAQEGIALTMETAPELPPLETDAALLRTAVGALLRNALEAMPAGGTLALSARLERGAGGGDRVRIEVRDTGEGMDAATARQATEPHFTTREGHVGLGLAHAAGIAHLLRGELLIASTPGEGTAVTLALPLSWAAAPVESLAPVESVTAPDAANEISGAAPPPVVELLDREATDAAVEELIEQERSAEPAHVPNRAQVIQEEMPFVPRPQSPTRTAPDPEKPVAEEEESAAEAPRMERPALLLVDDEQIVLDLVRDIFEGEPFDVIAMPDGHAALRAMDREGDRVFLAVVDATMPEMSGWEVAERLARERPGLSIYIATGYDTREADIPPDARDAVTGLLRKPFRAGALRDLIERELTR